MRSSPNNITIKTIKILLLQICHPRDGFSYWIQSFIFPLLSVGIILFFHQRHLNTVSDLTDNVIKASISVSMLLIYFWTIMFNRLTNVGRKSKYRDSKSKSQASNIERNREILFLCFQLIRAGQIILVAFLWKHIATFTWMAYY